MDENKLTDEQVKFLEELPEEKLWEFLLDNYTVSLAAVMGELTCTCTECGASENQEVADLYVCHDVHEEGCKFGTVSNVIDALKGY